MHTGSAFPVPKLSSAASCSVQRELYSSVSFCSTNANRKDQRQLENLSQCLDSIFLPHNLPHKFPHNMGEICCAQKIKALYLAIVLLDTTRYMAVGWGSWIRTNEWRSQRHSENSKNGWKQPKNPIKSPDFNLLPHNLPHNCVVGHKRKTISQGAHRNSDALLGFYPFSTMSTILYSFYLKLFLKTLLLNFQIIIQCRNF